MSSVPSRRSSPAAAGLLGVTLVLTACGGSDAAEPGAGPTGAAPTATESAWPVTVTGDNGEVTLAEQPERIVSLSATATEMLFAIGAGPQVEAVDSTSNHPPEAPTTDLSAFTPNAEAIAAYEPDLVVISDDINGVLGALETLEVPTLHLGLADDLQESYEQMRTLGAATGHDDDAAKLVTDVEDRIAAAVEEVGGRAEGLSVYHELDPTLYAASSATFIGSIYELFGLENIADGAGDAAGGFPQLSAEYVVDQAPDVIVLADTVCCGQSAETVAQRPAFDTVPAVRDGRIVEVNDDVASRWGPRVADFAEQLSDALRG